MTLIKTDEERAATPYQSFKELQELSITYPHLTTKLAKLGRQVTRQLRDTIRDNPSDVQATVQLGLISYELEDYGECRRVADQITALSDDPQELAWTHYLMALLAGLADSKEQARKRSKRVKEHLLTALTLDPGHPMSALRLARHLHEDDDPSRTDQECAAAALSILNRSIELNPENAELLVAAAEIHTFEDDPSPALDYLLKAEQLQPLDWHQAILVHEALGKLDKWREAVEWAIRSEARRRAEQLRVNFQTWALDKGLQGEKFEEILRRAAEQLESDPGNNETRGYLSICLHCFGTGTHSGSAWTLKRTIEERAPNNFLMITERATQRLNADLLASEAYELVPVENPWTKATPPETVSLPLITSDIQH